MRTLEQIATDKEIRTMIWVDLDKPQRMRAMYDVRYMMSPQAFWKLFGEVWTNSESLFENEQYISKIFVRDIECRGLMMTTSERKLLRELPEWVTIYRGCSDLNMKSWSWTCKEEVARFFARRATSNTSTYVQTGYVHRENIIAYFSGRNESEVVTDSHDVKFGAWEHMSAEEMHENRKVYWAAQTGRLGVPMVIPMGDEDRFKKVQDERLERLTKFHLSWAYMDLLVRIENAHIIPTSVEQMLEVGDG